MFLNLFLLLRRKLCISICDLIMNALLPFSFPMAASAHACKIYIWFVNFIHMSEYFKLIINNFYIVFCKLIISNDFHWWRYVSGVRWLFSSPRGSLCLRQCCQCRKVLNQIICSGFLCSPRWQKIKYQRAIRISLQQIINGFSQGLYQLDGVVRVFFHSLIFNFLQLRLPLSFTRPTQMNFLSTFLLFFFKNCHESRDCRL